MAKILYGLCSVGMGHAIRTTAILEHLISKKHDVMVVTSHKTYDLLRKHFKNVYNIEGFELVFRENKILNARTLFKNIGKFSPSTLNQLKSIKEKIRKFDPDVVISDWETFSSYTAKELKKPLISFDNQHFLVYGKFKVKDKYMSEYLKARVFLYSLVSKAKYYVITYFENTQIKKKKNVFLVPPIIRDDILNANVTKGDYVLVYQTTETYRKLLNVLRNIDDKFIVYGYNMDKKEGNLTFKKFDEAKGFIRDLSGAKAVICNGGFTLISESIHLGKPLLVLPILGHFEQILNGLYVKRRRYGDFCERLSANAVKNFLGDLKEYKMEKKKGSDNRKLFWILDQIIKRESTK